MKDNFKNLTSDRCFKYIFKHNIYSKKLIESFYKFIHKNINIDIIYNEAQKLLESDNINIKVSYSDIVIETNNAFFILEMYTNFNKEDYFKNLNYMSKVFNYQVFKNDKYTKHKKVICLSFVTSINTSNNNLFINSYDFINTDTNIASYGGIVKMYIIRLDKIPSILYTKSEFIRMLRFIKARSEKEMNIYAKGDKILMAMSETLKRFYSDPLVIRDSSPKWQRKRALEKEYEKGIEKGRIDAFKKLSKKLNISIEKLEELSK